MSYGEIIAPVYVGSLFLREVASSIREMKVFAAWHPDYQGLS